MRPSSHCKQMEAESDIFEPAPTSGRVAFLERFFAALEHAGITYVVLHSYATLPHEIAGDDIGLGVAESDRAKIPALIRSVARSAGWLVVQRIQHELFAEHTLLVNPDDPREFLALDVCSHYAKNGALLVRDSVLLKKRHRDVRGFFIPVPLVEFVYLLTKSVAEDGAPGKHAKRLRELAAEDPIGAQRSFTALFDASGSVENWLPASPDDWRALAARMCAGNRYNFWLRGRELRRRILRALRRARFHIALYGHGGSGKSTLLRNLEESLPPCVADLRRQFTPCADATFVLDGDPRAIRARELEPAVGELERLHQALRNIASWGARMHLVSAHQAQVAAQVTRTILQLLAYRELRRDVPFAKRAFDIVVASLALFLLLPLIALIGVLVRLNFGAPVLFTQQRPGLGGRPFTIWKFRTMPDLRDVNGRMLPDAQRLTTFGHILRSSSLDELPELINVLRGEMSLVGPRPLLMEYLPRYSVEQMRRHDVLPGITGLAQIKGRNAANWSRKFELDVWYVDHRSMWLDLKIIAVTVWKVLTREGINQSASVTSEPFMGNVDLAHSDKGSLGARNNGARAMNVLLTCAGRRCFAIRAFKQALNNCGRVLACDATAQAPALQIADKAFVVPSVDADNYVDVILRICRDQRVRLLIPALEPELPLFATHRARFLEIETLPLVSSAEIVATCYDKLETAKFLERCGLIVPRTYVELEAVRQALARGEITFPLVVKPRWGVSSIGLAIAEDDEELHLAFNTTEKQIGHSSLAQVSAGAPGKCILIQERLSGEEYGLDIVNDLNGSHVCTFVKRKLKMRAGQTDRAVTVKDQRLEKLGQLIGEQLGHLGILDCDLFVSDEGCRVIDLNPRIGGGYPFSHIAGANVPAALIAWMNGEAADPRCFQIQPNLAIARCDEYVAIDPRTAFPTAQRRAQTHESTQKQLR